MALAAGGLSVNCLTSPGFAARGIKRIGPAAQDNLFLFEASLKTNLLDSSQKSIHVEECEK